jgi:hypothetical protein
MVASGQWPVGRNSDEWRVGCQKMAGPFRSSGLLETNWAAPFSNFRMFIASDDICEAIGKPQQATGNRVGNIQSSYYLIDDHQWQQANKLGPTRTSIMVRT